MSAGIWLRSLIASMAANSLRSGFNPSVSSLASSMKLAYKSAIFAASGSAAAAAAAAPGTAGRGGGRPSTMLRSSSWVVSSM